MKNVHETSARRSSERKNTNWSIKQTNQKITVFYFLTTPTIRTRARQCQTVKLSNFHVLCVACKRTTNYNNRLIDRINPFGFDIVRNNFAVPTRPAPSAYTAILGPSQRVRGTTTRLRLILASLTVARDQKQRHRIRIYVENRGASASNSAGTAERWGKANGNTLFWCSQTMSSRNGDRNDCRRSSRNSSVYGAR